MVLGNRAAVDTFMQAASVSLGTQVAVTVFHGRGVDFAMNAAPKPGEAPPKEANTAAEQNAAEPAMPADGQSAAGTAPATGAICLAYCLSRGLFVGASFEHTLILPLVQENEEYYGKRVPVADLLSGAHVAPESDKLTKLRAILDKVSPPADEVESDSSSTTSSDSEEGDPQPSDKNR